MNDTQVQAVMERFDQVAILLQEILDVMVEVVTKENDATSDSL